jgi:glycosyltransferase involved in cell wall biosynthesis
MTDERRVSGLPLVSIVVATYNRSNVLAYAIKSVLRQTCRDWELIVVGDACTDDTAAVVASFHDSRIQFHNLERNVGEQSGPNNEGCRRARGRYIAFLNQDDLWLADHLETLIAGIERTSADLVFALMCVVQPDGASRLGNASPTGRYEPHLAVPASAWLLRRTLIDDIGPWRFYREIHMVPSQDWLLRARQAGKALELISKVTVVAIPSGSRRGSYANREEREHRLYFNRLVREPDFIERELTAMSLDYAMADPRSSASLRVWPYLQRAAKNAARRLLLAAGMNPISVRIFLEHPRKGGYVDALRRTRGLPELDRGRAENRRAP